MDIGQISVSQYSSSTGETVGEYTPSVSLSSCHKVQTGGGSHLWSSTEAEQPPASPLPAAKVVDRLDRDALPFHRLDIESVKAAFKEILISLGKQGFRIADSKITFDSVFKLVQDRTPELGDEIRRNMQTWKCKIKFKHLKVEAIKVLRSPQPPSPTSTAISSVDGNGSGSSWRSVRTTIMDEQEVLSSQSPLAVCVQLPSLRSLHPSTSTFSFSPARRSLRLPLSLPPYPSLRPSRALSLSSSPTPPSPSLSHLTPTIPYQQQHTEPSNHPGLRPQQPVTAAAASAAAGLRDATPDSDWPPAPAPKVTEDVGPVEAFAAPAAAAAAGPAAAAAAAAEGGGISEESSLAPWPATAPTAGPTMLPPLDGPSQREDGGGAAAESAGRSHPLHLPPSPAAALAAAATAALPAAAEGRGADPAEGALAETVRRTERAGLDRDRGIAPGRGTVGQRRGGWRGPTYYIQTERSVSLAQIWGMGWAQIWGGASGAALLPGLLAERAAPAARNAALVRPPLSHSRCPPLPSSPIYSPPPSRT